MKDELFKEIEKIIDEYHNSDRKLGVIDDLEEYKNPKKEKESAYTDKDGFRLDSFIVDKDKGRRR